MKGRTDWTRVITTVLEYSWRNAHYASDQPCKLVQYRPWIVGYSDLNGGLPPWVVRLYVAYPLRGFAYYDVVWCSTEGLRGLR